MQIRNRLTLQFIIIVAGIMLVSLFYIHFQFKKHLEDEFYDNLRSKALMTAEMVVGKYEQPSDLLLSQQQDASPLASAFNENIAIYLPDGQRIYTFNPTQNDIPAATILDVQQMNECRFRHTRFHALGVHFTNRKGHSFVVVSEAVFSPEHLSNLARILVWVFFIIIAMVAVGGRFFAGQAMSPVIRIMNQVDALLPTDMSHRLQISRQQDELGRLVITFNKLLDRIQQAFNTQKMFLSNVSHELKNPLNIITAQIEIMLAKERTNEEYCHTLASVLDDVRELNDVSNKLMQLAKINSDGSAIAFERLRIDEMIWQTKASLLKSHPEYRISFEVVNLPENEEKLYMKGNEQLLKTALLNLMDNGCKFSPDKNVKVRLAFTPQGAMSVEIQDQGPGIAQEEMPLVFEPFYRSSRTSSIKGSGIGLSLVSTIMKLHDIDMRVNSFQQNGTTFRLQFPMLSEN